MIVSAFRQNFVKVSPDALMNGESVGLVQHDAGGAERARPLISVPPADQGVLNIADSRRLPAKAQVLRLGV